MRTANEIAQYLSKAQPSLNANRHDMTVAEEIAYYLRKALAEKRVAKSPNFKAFCNEVGHDVIKLFRLREYVTHTLGELFPPGAPARKTSARAALDTLIHSVLLMTPAERFDLFHSASNADVQKLLGVNHDDHIKVYHDAVMQWFDVLAAMKVKPKPSKRSRKEHVNTERWSGLVNIMSYCWQRHFDIPKSSPNSRFYSAVVEVCRIAFPSETPPASGTVAKILCNKSPSK